MTLHMSLGTDDLNQGTGENKLSFEALGDISRISKTEMTVLQDFLKVWGPAMCRVSADNP